MGTAWQLWLLLFCSDFPLLYLIKIAAVFHPTCSHLCTWFCMWVFVLKPLPGCGCGDKQMEAHVCTYPYPDNQQPMSVPLLDSAQSCCTLLCYIALVHRILTHFLGILTHFLELQFSKVRLYSFCSLMFL